MTDRLTDAQIEELKRLAKAATPGPWIVEGPEFNDWVGPGRGQKIAEGSTDCGTHDLALIAAMRNALPALLAERRGAARAAEAAREALRSMVNAQAEDDGLWCQAETAPEGYLQQELRKLHKAVEAALATIENAKK